MRMQQSTEAIKAIKPIRLAAKKLIGLPKNGFKFDTMHTFATGQLQTM
jgi:hypothetical protein